MGQHKWRILVPTHGQVLCLATSAQNTLLPTFPRHLKGQCTIPSVPVPQRRRLMKEVHLTTHCSTLPLLSFLPGPPSTCHPSILSIPPSLLEGAILPSTGNQDSCSGVCGVGQASLLMLFISWMAQTSLMQCLIPTGGTVITKLAVEQNWIGLIRCNLNLYD